MTAYYAIIPANVRYDKELTPNAKLLYAEITALCNQTGRCWATNQYFATLYGVSTTSVSKWISQLIAKGYIFSEIEYKEGTKEILNRYLSLVKEGIEEKLNTPIEEKLKDNNININTTFNNIVPTQNFCFKTELLKLGLNEKLANEWLKIRKKSKNNESAFKLFKKELENSKLDINTFVQVAIENGWQLPRAYYPDIIKARGIDSRKHDFVAKLEPFKAKLSREILNEFYNYNISLGKDGLMAFERENFNLEYNLQTFIKNRK